MIPEDLQAKVQECGNGVDCVARFQGRDGWPPEMTVPECTMTDDLSLYVERELEAAPAMAQPDAALVNTPADPPVPVNLPGMKGIG